MSTIVVGVDDSPESLAALRYALQEARLHGYSLKAVAVWHVPMLVYGAAVGPAPPTTESYERAAEIALADALAEVEEEAEGVSITEVVRVGDPAEVLVDESKGAAQLVVGCHQLGHLRSLFHHSVSQHCAHGASCPVTVVHGA